MFCWSAAVKREPLIRRYPRNSSLKKSVIATDFTFPADVACPADGSSAVVAVLGALRPIGLCDSVDGGPH